MYSIWADDICIFDDTVTSIVNILNNHWEQVADLSEYEALRLYIQSNGKWDIPASGSAIRSKIVPIPDEAAVLTLVKGSGTPYYSLLKNNTYSDNTTPSYATGYSGRKTYSDTEEVVLPDDAKYVWIYTHTTSADITPSSVKFTKDTTTTIRNEPVLSPKLTLTANAAGSLTITLPPGSAGYDTIERLKTTIRVEPDLGGTIWMGRVLSEEKDLWNCRKLFCEGALAFLNDTIPMVAFPAPVEGGMGTSAEDALEAILVAHNGKVSDDRKVYLGQVTVQGTIVTDADGSTSLELINSKLLGSLGGVLQMRYPNGKPTLDWLADYPGQTGSTQSIEFGKNLLDFTRGWDMTEYATYCYVAGKDCNSGWQYIAADGSNPAPKDLYGRIEKYFNYSDLENAGECVAAAQAYLRTQQFEDMTLDVSALDLRLLGVSGISSFRLLDVVTVRSWAHGLNDNFAVTGIDLPLDAPEQAKYTLSNANVAYVRRVKTLTQKNVQAQTEQREYTDTAAEGAVTAAGAYTNEVKAELELADDAITARVSSAEGDISQLTIDVNGISTEVSNIAGDVSTVEQTANEIKAQVTDAYGNYTVANLKSDGFYVGNSQSRTVITGSMIRVDQLQGNIISILDSGGNTVANMFASSSDFTLGISAANVDFARDGDIVKIYSPSQLYFTSIQMTLAQLLGI